MAFTPIVNQEKCIGCGECVDVCPVDVYEIQDGKCAAISPEDCLGCESCVEVCPQSIISIEEN